MSKIYVAGPMRGIPEFNFPAFHVATDMLRAQGHTVFNPAERDNEHHGTDISKGNASGDEEVAAKEHGFSLREALADDTRWICLEADTIALLPGWQKSKGARAEKALAEALGHKVLFIDGSDWIAHNGSVEDCPIDGNVFVDVRFRNGEENTLGSRAENWYWLHNIEPYEYDIVAYRVHGE